MDCDRIRSLIDASLDEGHPFDERITGHLAACESCRAYGGRMGALGARLRLEARQLVDAAPQPDVDGLLARLATRPVSRRGPIAIVRYVAIAAAALVMLAVFGGLAGRRSPRQRELTDEQAQALRILEKAREDALKELAEASGTAPHSEQIGRRLIDDRMTGQLTDARSGIRSFQAFLIECLPVPAFPEHEDDTDRSMNGPGHSRTTS